MAPRNDVGEPPEPHQVRHEHNDAEAPSLHRGQHPDHEGDQPASEDGVQQRGRSIELECLPREIAERDVHTRCHNRQAAEGEREQERTDQVGDQHGSPEP